MRVVIFAIVVLALITIAKTNLSKGEPLPTPPSMVAVHPDTR
jgi:hypothetical protein